MSVPKLEVSDIQATVLRPRLTKENMSSFELTKLHKDVSSYAALFHT